MFEQSLVETGHTLGTRKPASMLASLAVQIGVVGLLVLIPLLRVAVLPGGARSAPLTVPLAEALAPSAAPVAATRPAPTHWFDSRLPALTVTTPPSLRVAEAAPAAAPAWLGSGNAGVSTPTAPINLIPLPAPQPAPAPPPEKPLPVGGEVEAARCLACPPPVYPAFARQARIQGTVELQAEIGRDGNVTSLRRISGNALLSAAAQRAVRAWRYQPLLLDGRPVAVTTVITVRFRLQ